jgi:general secretion pathway protein B
VSLPELTLEFHVYSPNPAERRVRVNSAGYQEGDTLNEGPRVIAVTTEGVVLSHNGRLFLLTPD